jgi:hypothetical protein
MALLRETLRLLLFVSSLVLLPLACDRDRGPQDKVEDAGDEVKDAVEEAGDKIEDAGDEVKDKVEDAGDKVEDAGDEIKDAVNDSI